MNIFYLHNDPSIAAQYHLDKHVVKMILESAQMLSTAHRILDGKEEKIIAQNKRGKSMTYTRYVMSDLNKNSLLYSSTHINHPCSIWCRANINNYMWLHSLFVKLCDEYTYRYEKEHKSYTMLSGILKNAPINISKDSFTQPAQAMPDKYKSDDPVIAYRNYYIHEKRTFARWTKRQVPEWFI